MPSRKVLAGDTVYLRATALAVGTDAMKVLIDDGDRLAVTVWAPARECAKHEDIGELKPIRRENPFHIQR